MNNRKKRSNGLAHYKLVFKPEKYTGKLAHWNNDYDNGPLLPWKNNTKKRCYFLSQKYNFSWAAIYDQTNPTEMIDEYTKQEGWKIGEH